jgi:hypothetical protein
MHAVFHGVFRDLLQRITKSFSGTKTSEFNKRLQNVHLPLEVPRTLRSLADFHKGNWRVSELRTVTYLAPLLFRGLLPLSQYNNLILLSTSMYYLHSASVSEDVLPKCQRQIQRFCRQLQTIYKDSSIYTYNVHLLLHLTIKVKEAGPLYTHSCDEFESLFAKMLSVQHGSRGAAEQILRYFSIRSVLDRTNLHESITSAPLSLLCKKITTKYFSSHMQTIRNVTLLGPPTMQRLPQSSADVNFQGEENVVLLECYNRSVINGHMYKTYEVCKRTIRIDCYLYVKRKYYVVQHIALIDNSVFFLCNRLSVKRLRTVLPTSKLELSYPLFKVTAYKPGLHYLRVDEPFTKCCSVNLNQDLFLLPLPTAEHRS